ncbi:n-terminal domain protein [Ichthyophthirius multifiliis]|uniref:N-terminal domain protein n=1 Tax=Ichthyophthirius multifiliis TaxID=5932 RepID=G0QZ51_ICHMU|nr:n-terminal domain protein [Ichthyophthirius multifiliis]EGR29502.1 n-terminal domain protein [Ichthyophthirius multifiliis]|eukprot:XP_004030738.1 n-terminal domain protein [Ichthyophthirius multifiliis]
MQQHVYNLDHYIYPPQTQIYQTENYQIENYQTQEKSQYLIKQNKILSQPTFKLFKIEQKQKQLFGNILSKPSLNNEMFQNKYNINELLEFQERSLENQKTDDTIQEQQQKKKKIVENFNDTNEKEETKINIFKQKKYENYKNPQQVLEYRSEIIQNLYKKETEIIIFNSYFSFQYDITDCMRTILIDWLVLVNFKFNLLPETLYLTVHIIDKYLSRKQIQRQKLQLLGISALFIACKYEEIYPPSLQDICNSIKGIFYKGQILQMEGDIIQSLNFEITFPSIFRFCEYFCCFFNFQDQEKFLAFYFCELALLEIAFQQFRGSVVGFSACFLSLKILKNECLWNFSGNMEIHEELNEDRVRCCVKQIVQLERKIEDNFQYQNIKKKYSQNQFLCVGQIVLDKKKKQE